MILILSCIILIAIVFFLTLYFEGGHFESIGEKIGNSVFILFISIFAGGIIGMFASIITISFSSTEYVVDWQADIYAFQDNTSSGFYLRGGRNNNAMTYYYLTRYGRGYKVYSADYQDSTIVETNERPKVIHYKEQIKSEFIRKYIALFEPSGYSYEFYIPKNSIKMDFNLDMKN